MRKSFGRLDVLKGVSSNATRARRRHARPQWLGEVHDAARSTGSRIIRAARSVSGEVIGYGQMRAGPARPRPEAENARLREQVAGSRASICSSTGPRAGERHGGPPRRARHGEGGGGGAGRQHAGEVGLETRGRVPDTVSAGQQQRGVQLPARLPCSPVMCSTRVTSALDPSRWRVLRVISVREEGMTMSHVTHEIPFAATSAPHHSGRRRHVEQGDAAKLIDNRHLKRMRLSAPLPGRRQPSRGSRHRGCFDALDRRPPRRGGVGAVRANESRPTSALGPTRWDCRATPHPHLQRARTARPHAEKTGTRKWTAPHAR